MMSWIIVYLLVGLIVGELGITAFEKNDIKMSGHEYLAGVLLWPLLFFFGGNNNA